MFDEAACEVTPEFHQFLLDLSRHTTQEQAASLEADTTRAEWKKLGQREALKRKVAAWSPRRRAISSFTILDDNARAASDQMHATSLLAQHWQPVFSAPEVSELDIDEILAHSAVARATFDWEIREEDFDYVI
jgi:hypothetical protein